MLWVLKTSWCIRARIYPFFNPYIHHWPIWFIVAFCISSVSTVHYTIEVVSIYQLLRYYKVTNYLQPLHFWCPRCVLVPVYRVSQELKSLLRDLIPDLILSQKRHMHMGPIRNGSEVMSFYNTINKLEKKDEHWVFIEIFC